MESTPPPPDNVSEATTTPAATMLGFLEILVRHRRLIARLVVAGTLGATVTAALMPRWYKSTASVFPAEKADILGALDGVSSLAKAFSPAKALTSLTGNPETDRYLAILKSGAVLSAVIDRFDLVHVYDITSYPREKTAKELLGNVEFVVESEGNLTITVYDRDPQRAADMANFFVEMLNRTNTELQVQNARGNRLFIEERHRKNLEDLAAAEDTLKAFQKAFGIIALPEQLEASVKAMAEIGGQLALKEVQEGVLRRTLSADHPSVLAAQIESMELRRKITEMNEGKGRSSEAMKALVPFNRVPDLGNEYIRRFRNVEVQYKILQFITPLYEQAKVEERRQTPSVLVLDRAGPAERKAKPKISLFALLGFVISALAAIIAVLVLEALSRLRDSQRLRLDALLAAVRSDWFGLKVQRRRGR
jgi:tyrosine-protein kinase Etk/Wzc